MFLLSIDLLLIVALSVIAKQKNQTGCKVKCVEEICISHIWRRVKVIRGIFRSPFPGMANTVRLRLCLPSAVFVAQLCEQEDQEDQEPTTQSAEQATSQASSVGGGSSTQWVSGTSPPKHGIVTQLK